MTFISQGAASKPAAAVERGKPGLLPVSYVEIYRAAPVDRVEMIKAGVHATTAKRILADLSLSQASAFAALNLSPATVNRKALRKERLSLDESERVLGVAKLLGQVQATVEESGDPESFDASRWMSRWLNEPLPALGDRRPIEFLQTMEGQALVSGILARLQSGAYA